MQLYFLRHGVAVDHGAPGYEDNDDARPLTPDGIDLAQRVAKALAAMAPADIILTSPLPRARQTADITAQALGVDVVETGLLGLSFNRDGLAEALREAEAGRRKALRKVMLVGHEPSMSQTIGALVGPGLRLVLKKNGLARVDVQGPDLGGGELRWLLTPGQLKRLG